MTRPDGPKEACGIFGVFGHPDAAKLTYFGLYALQHRGQESAGIVVSDGKQVAEQKGMGLVPDVFDEAKLNALNGHMAIGLNAHRIPDVRRAIRPLWQRPAMWLVTAVLALATAGLVA